MNISQIIGDQGPNISLLWFIYSKWQKANPNESIIVWEIELPAVSGFCFAIHTVNGETTKPVNLKEIFDSLPYSDVSHGNPHTYTQKPWKATSIHHLIRLSNNIAKKTRRGLGRYLLCKDKRILEKLDKPQYINNAFKVIETPFIKSDEVIVCYAGNNPFDKPLAMQANNIYVHPDYKQWMMKVKI